jgi:hypothetical protein
VGAADVSHKVSDQAGEAVGVPLSDGEDRAHTHNVAGVFNLPSKHVSGADGLNFDGAKQGPTDEFLNKTGSAGSGYPFVQLTACRYNAVSLQPAPAIPVGAISLWDASSVKDGCPTNTEPLQAGAGRLLTLTDAPGYGIAGNPAALEPGLDVTHDHSFNATITLSEFSYAGIDGCCNDSPVPAGSVGMTGVSSSTSTGLPQVAVLACNTTSAYPTPVLPAGALLLTTAGGCPSGWVPLNGNAAGRVVVATPVYGVPGKAFGAARIPGLGEGWTPDHTHPFGNVAWLAKVAGSDTRDASRNEASGRRIFPRLCCGVWRDLCPCRGRSNHQLGRHLSDLWLLCWRVRPHGHVPVRGTHRLQCSPGELAAFVRGTGV